ncbi:MAG TPA: ABC transporter permease, partial [Amaricoccus sp.]|nr:ABC transporter permease [Amaricoccus sp.]
MTTLVLPVPSPWPRRLLWLALLAGTLAFAHLPRGALTGLWKDVPETLHLPLAAWLSAVMDWLVTDARLGPITFRDLTRAVSGLLSLPLTAATSLLATGLMRGEGSTAVQLLPPLPWFAVLISATLVGLHAGGRRLALGTAAALLYLAVFGQWQSAMVTLASIVVAVPLGVAGGLALGIAAYRHPRLDRA